ncbi:MAG: DUF1003 domain-containing protein [Acidobacteriota bacterium]
MARKLLNREWSVLSAKEQEVLESIATNSNVARNINRDMDATRTFAERTADQIAAFGGSWKFLGLFAGTLIVWIILNSYILTIRGDEFDPYPYILLNLFLSMLAAIQAPVIMMSQNRQAVHDRLDASHDFEVNLKAELEIRRLHEKLDDLRETQWSELVRMQQQQLNLLERLLRDRIGNSVRQD